MIVYIEGVDGSGKSTFAKHITKYLHEHNFHVVPFAEKFMVTHPWREDRISARDLQIKIRALTNSSEVFIVDRGELSDIIYRVFDHHKFKPLMSLNTFYNLYNICKKKYIIIHCDSKKSEELMLKRGEDNLVSIEEHQKLRYLFNIIMPMFDAIKYDVEQDINNPNYLDNISLSIKMKLLEAGAKDDA